MIGGNIQVKQTETPEKGASYRSRRAAPAGCGWPSTDQQPYDVDSDSKGQLLGVPSNYVSYSRFSSRSETRPVAAEKL